MIVDWVGDCLCYGERFGSDWVDDCWDVGYVAVDYPVYLGRSRRRVGRMVCILDLGRGY